MASPLVPLTAAAIAIATLVAYVRRRNTSIAPLPGPTQGHWLLGTHSAVIPFDRLQSSHGAQGHQPAIQRSEAGEVRRALKRVLTRPHHLS